MFERIWQPLDVGHWSERKLEHMRRYRRRSFTSACQASTSACKAVASGEAVKWSLHPYFSQVSALW